MSSIIKKVSIARGYDPRDFALFCYGGGGPAPWHRAGAGAENSARDRSARARQLFRDRHAARRPADRYSADVCRSSQSREPRQGIGDIRGPGSNGPRCACCGNSAMELSRSSARPRCAIRANTTPSRFPFSKHDDAPRLRARFDQEYLRRYGHVESSSRRRNCRAAFPCNASHAAARNRAPRQIGKRTRDPRSSDAVLFSFSKKIASCRPRSTIDTHLS